MSLSIYGKCLKELNLSADGVPSFLPVVCEFLRSQGVKSKGIFRLCGNCQTVNDLGVLFSCPQVAIPPCSTVNDVASFLKQWLRSLPEPLLPPQKIGQFFQANDPRSVVLVLQSIDEVNRKSLAYIFALIKKIVENAESNLMTFANLSTCFVTSLHQTLKGIQVNFNFRYFYTVALDLLNDAENDFLIAGNTKAVQQATFVLKAPSSMNNIPKIIKEKNLSPPPQTVSPQTCESGGIYQKNSFNMTAPVVRPRFTQNKRRTSNFAAGSHMAMTGIADEEIFPD